MISDGIISYTIPLDGPAGENTDVADLSYDGKVLGDKIQGGLGRLVDGVHGEDYFKIDIGYGKGNNSNGLRDTRHVKNILPAASPDVFVYKRRSPTRNIFSSETFACISEIESMYVYNFYKDFKSKMDRRIKKKSKSRYAWHFSTFVYPMCTHCGICIQCTNQTYNVIIIETRSDTLNEFRFKFGNSFNLTYTKPYTTTKRIVRLQSAHTRLLL